MSGFGELDLVLRGEPRKACALGPLLRVCLALAVVSGICIGMYGLLRPDGPEWRQLLASGIKVPALVFLTLLVTFPSLYVFNAILGPRLQLAELTSLVFSGVGVLVAVLAAFGPIVAFFSVTTPSYLFVVLLNVAVYAVAGLFGMAFLHRGLPGRVSAVEAPVLAGCEREAASGSGLPAVSKPGACAVSPVFYVWMILFGVVGAQMSWVLRPFIGAPNLPFTWFRPRQSSFFEAVWHALWNVVGG